MENETDKIDEFEKYKREVVEWIDKFPYHPLSKELLKTSQFNAVLMLKEEIETAVEESKEAREKLGRAEQEIKRLEGTEPILKNWLRSQLKRIEAVDIENYNYQRRLNILALLLSKI